MYPLSQHYTFQSLLNVSYFQIDKIAEWATNKVREAFKKKREIVCFWSALAPTPAQLQLGAKEAVNSMKLLPCCLFLSLTINLIKRGISGKKIQNKS